jgi:hypothetical protein
MAMNRFVNTLLNGIGPGRRSVRNTGRQVSPGVECLETRNMPSAVTFNSLGVALGLKTCADAARLANDVISIETAHPTLLKSQLVSDAQALKSDAGHGNLNAIAADAGKLLKDANTEAALINVFHLSQTPLVKNATVRQDAITLIVDVIDAAYLISLSKAYHHQPSGAQYYQSSLAAYNFSQATQASYDFSAGVIGEPHGYDTFNDL